MKEINANIWDFLESGFIVIPTNGTVRKDGACVMGRGLALQAKRKFPGFDHILGSNILKNGNELTIFYSVPANLITFPVKHNWWEKADLELIRKNAKILSQIKLRIFLPLVGCGNGGLDLKDVMPILEEYLTDDRYTLVYGPMNVGPIRK